MYDIDIALSWEFRELITRESETIFPLFLSYSFLSSSSLTNGSGSWVVGTSRGSWVVGVGAGVGASNIII